MVTKTITGKSMSGALQYNENKVLEGKAELILTSGFAGTLTGVLISRLTLA